MNYPFYLNLIDLLAGEKINASQFIQNLGYLKGRLNKKCYPLMWNLIDSHDTARFLHLCDDNKKKQHLAAAFQLLLPGMPMIYYGDEFAMPGANDPDCRRGMYWDEEYQDKEMFEWYKQLLKVRKNHACIVEGEPMELAAIGQASQLVDVLKSLGITDREVYLKSLTELLSECLPNTSADALTWKMNIDEAGGDDLGM